MDKLHQNIRGRGSAENPANRFEKIDYVPDDGEISQDDVVFLCNHCRQDDLIYKDGMYMCPACLMPGENFECMLCESKEVKMVVEREEQLLVRLHPGRG